VWQNCGVGTQVGLSLLEAAMSLSDEMQDERTKVVASTRDLQAGVIETWMTDGSGAPLPSNQEVRPSTDRGIAEQVRTPFIHLL
jgi:hypothetical protein